MTDGPTFSSATDTSTLRSNNSRPRLDIRRRSCSTTTPTMAGSRKSPNKAGPGITVPNASRGCAFGDYDNDGDVDFVINTVNGLPQLVRCDSSLDNNWIKVKCIGMKSNRSAIGARIKCVTTAPGEPKPHQQIDEVRSGGGYISQSDLRIHFGIGKAAKIDVLEVRWPSGQVDTLKDVKVNQLVYIKEGQGIIKTEEFKAAKKTARSK